MGSGWIALCVVLCSSVIFTECTVTVKTPKRDETVNTTILVVCTTTSEALDGWYHKDKKISDQLNQRVHVVSTGDTHKMTIQHIQQDDGGSYECRGKNGNKAPFVLWINAQFVDPVSLKQYLRMTKTDDINVEVLGFPKPKVTWKDKNDKEINFALDRYELLSSGSLRIKNVNKKDSGTYTVTFNQQDLRTKFHKIEVIATFPPIIAEPPHPEKRYVTKGYNTSFVCKVDGEPKPTIRWLDPAGRPVSTFNPRYNIDNQTFYIYNIQKSDKGIWTCEVSSGDVTIKASAEIIDVYEEPEIFDPAFPWVYYPELYKEYTIACKANGYPKPTVVIRKGGRLHPRLETSPGVALVKYFQVREHDLGNYSCEAWSNARDSNGKVIVTNQTFALFTKDKPVINPDGSPSEIFSYVGNPKPLKINCDFVSWPKANVTIWRGFYELTNGTDQATLYVWTYSWEDFGPYSCIGSNIYGEVNYTVWIRHATPPGKPENIKIVADCDRANFTWDPPSYKGGMLIDRYVITDQNDNKFNSNDSYPEYRINGLEANKEYTITIQAMNRQGAGTMAKIVFRTNATCVPGRPIVFSPVVEDLDRTFLDLRWKPPENIQKKNRDDLYYRIVVKEEDDIEETGHIKVYTSNTYEQRIGGLRKNVSYRFELVAINEKDQRSPPTYVNYFVVPNAWDSAHTLTASFWCILTGLILVFNIGR